MHRSSLPATRSNINLFETKLKIPPDQGGARGWVRSTAMIAGRVSFRDSYLPPVTLEVTAHPPSVPTCALASDGRWRRVAKSQSHCYNLCIVAHVVCN